MKLKLKKVYEIFAFLLVLVMVLATPLSALAESVVTEPESIEMNAPAEEPAPQAPEEEPVPETPAEEPAQAALTEEPAPAASVEEPAPEEVIEVPAPAEEVAPEVVSEEAAVAAPKFVSAITAQPQDVTAFVKEDAFFEVGTSGEVKTVRWQVSKNNGKTWSNLSTGVYGSGTTLSVKNVQKSNDGYMYRANVTFKDGKKINSDPAKLTVLSLLITDQPQDLEVAPGEEAFFSVATEGSVLSCQWQYSKDGKRWTDLSTRVYGSSNVLNFTANESDNGRLYRVIVTARDLTRVTSDAAKLTVNKGPECPEQNFDVADEESGVSVKVDAPEGILPAGTQIKVEAVNLDALQNSIDDSEFAGLSALVAMDISFSYEGKEIQPNGYVNVTITSDEIDAAEEDLTILHVGDDGVITEVPRNTDEETALSAEAASEETVDSVSFQAKSFSTFIVSRNRRNVTIHYGYMEGGQFREFPDSQCLNTDVFPSNGSTVNASTNNYPNNRYVYLLYDFDGYDFSGAYYRTSTSTTPATASGSTRISPMLRTGTNLQYRSAPATINNSWDGAPTVADGSHIYMVYTPTVISTGGSGESGGGEGDTEDFEPSVGKIVSNMNDKGTYDVTLNVTGDQESIVSTARVIVVMDVSWSMRNNFNGTSGNPTRLSIAQSAIDSMADTLLGLNESGKPPMVEMGLVFFHQYARKVTFSGTDFTTNPGTFKNAVDAIRNQANVNDLYYGTNWEHGLHLANGMPASDKGKTYIVFVTDGDPTVRISRGNYSDTQLYNEANAGGSTQSTDLHYETTHNICQFGVLNSDNNANTNMGGGLTSEDVCQQAATVTAQKIVDAGKTLYAVGLSADAGPHDGQSGRLSDLANAAGAQYFLGTDSTTFNNYITQITQGIYSEIGLSNVVIEDGVTSMSQIQTQSMVTGDVESYRFFVGYPLTKQANGSYTYRDSYSASPSNHTVSGATVETATISTAPEDLPTYQGHKIYCKYAGDELVYFIQYSFDDSPGVKDGTPATMEQWEATVKPTDHVEGQNSLAWDLKGISLEDGIDYAVTFTIWPMQKAYDLIAELSNGDKKIEDLSTEEKEQLIVKINGTTYEYENGSWGGKSDSQLDELIAANALTAEFSIKTNTNLTASYTYGTDEVKTASYSQYRPGEMTLEDKTINVVKYWHNELDDETAVDGISLTVTQDGEYEVDEATGKLIGFTNISMGTATLRPNGVWVQEPEQDIFISCGLMSTDGTGTSGSINVREPGHEYEVVEPKNFGWYWDLTSDVYRPMVINKNAVMLIRDTEGSVEYVDKTWKVVDGKTYYMFDNAVYVAVDGEDLVLEAFNDRRSNLQIKKEILPLNGEEAIPEDIADSSFFTLQITMENPDGAHLGDENYDSDYDTFWFVVLKNPDADPEDVQPEDIAWAGDDGDGLVVSGATAEFINGSATGYYWFDNVKGDNKPVINIAIKAGWRICFTSVSRGTEYTVKELDKVTEGESEVSYMPDGFSFNNVSSAAETDRTEEEYKPTPAALHQDTMSAEGSFDQSNSEYYVDFVNDYAGVFYVYHSSDNKIEKIYLTDKRVTAERGESVNGKSTYTYTFNIVNETHGASLYGGYYSDYNLKGEDDMLTYITGKDFVFEKDTTGVATVYDGTHTGGLWGSDNAETCTPYEEGNREDPVWVSEDAYTDSGIAMNPKRDTIYYLKEVPAAKFLQPYLHYTYYKTSGNIPNVYLLSDVDDLNYDESGYVIVKANQVAQIVNSLTVKTTNGGISVKLTPTRVFGTLGVTSNSYLTYRTVISTELTPLKTELANGDTVKQYWVTPDRVFVTGITSRQYKGLANKEDIGVNSEDTIASEYEAFTTEETP